MTRAVAAAAVALAVLAAASPARGDGRFVSPEDVLRYPPEAEPPIIDLYTFGNGAVIFEKFGHAALCLTYREPRREPMCFNYGVTNFREVGKLAWGFLRTEQKFWVEPEPLRNLVAFYRDFEDRTIWCQRLYAPSWVSTEAKLPANVTRCAPDDPAHTGVGRISEDKARGLENRLLRDIRPEYRDYFYDHFFDNCTTRLRDMVDDAFTGELKQGTTTSYFPETFRYLGKRGFGPWQDYLGFTDFFGGRTLDRPPTVWESMFLPDLFRQQVEVRLGVKPTLIYERQGDPFPPASSSGRWLTILIAFVFALPLLAAKWRRRFEKPALIWACVPLVLWGLVCWGLSIVSSIPMFRWNEAVFLFVPFDVVLPFLGEPRRRIYARVRLGMVLLVSLLTAVGIFKQPLWVPILTAFLPFAILSFDLPWGLRRTADTDGDVPAVKPALTRESGTGKSRGQKKRGGKKRAA